MENRDLDKVLLKAVLHNITDNIVVIDTDHKVLCFNDLISNTLELYFGKKLKPGDDYRHFVIEPNMALYLQAFEKATSGQTFVIENETKEGDVSIWFQYKMAPVYDEGNNLIAVSLTATNINDNKQKEIALLKSYQVINEKTRQVEASEKYFRTLIETSSDAIVLMDATGRVLYQTPSTEKISGYSLKEIQNMDGIELIHPEDRLEDNIMFMNLVNTPGAVLQRKHRLKHKSGKYIWLEGNYRNLLHDENVNAIVLDYKDITENILADEQISKYNRELTLLNKVNDIILRAESEDHIYNAVCQCIVITGNYKLAWVCFKPENILLQFVEPLVACGETAYVKDLKIRLDEPDKSRGPTATVLHSGEKVITNNVSNSARFKPWLEGALKYGIASSLVLPLRLGDNSIGAINIYSDKQDAFNEHEVSTLERIANNISLAVQRLRSKKDILWTRHQLNERVKELTTIYKLNEVLQNEEQSVDEVFTKIVNLLPPGWQYPDICEARIVFDNVQYTTPGFKPSVHSQKAAFKLLDERSGFIEVIYTEQTSGEAEGVFLKEERDLINNIADIITVYFNKATQQRAVAESEIRFRGAFENASIGMAMVSLKGEFLKVNKEFCQMLGYGQEEFHSLTFADITEQEDLKRDIVYHQKLLKGEVEYYKVEKRYRHKTGHLVWCNVNVSPVKDENGNIQYFVTHAENITERIESELKFRNLVERSVVGVYIIQDGKFVYVNPMLSEESGYSQDELLSMPLEQLIHGSDWQVVQDNLETRLKGEIATTRYEVRAIRKNGEIIWIELFGSSTIYQGAPAVIGTMVNITERKHIYDELKMSEANLRSIFDNTEVAYLLLDSSFNVIACNQRMSHVYMDVAGINLKAGDNLPDLILPEKRENVLKTYRTVLNENRSIEYETFYNKDGVEKCFLAHVLPINDQNKVMGICVTSVEITKIKKLEAEREKIITDLLQKNRDLEQFAHIVSHNVRGPVSTILGFNNLIKESADDSEKQILLDGISTSVEKLDIVIKDLNEILKVRKVLAEAKTEVNLTELITDIEKSLAYDLTHVQSKIIIDFSGANEIFSVRSYLHSIFQNLITNSVKYCKPDVPPEITIRSQLAHNNIVICLKDNGIGIDLEKYNDRIFGLYQRFNLSVDGKGLGLFMVKTQVEALNGNIKIESQPGIGTSFYITLPQS
jgi:PAS domain S-box-containing protein